MNADRASRRLLPLGVAVTGVVLAHAVDYALTFPDPVRRSHELSATGHGYWPVALAAAVVAGGLAVAGAARRSARGAATGAFLRTAVRLSAIQVVLFCVIETVERLGAGVDPLPFLHSPQLAVGIALQVVVAVIATLFLHGIERTARRIAAILDRPRRSPRLAGRWGLPTDDIVARWWGTAGDARGPPELALT